MSAQLNTGGCQPNSQKRLAENLHKSTSRLTSGTQFKPLFKPVATNIEVPLPQRPVSFGHQANGQTGWPLQDGTNFGNNIPASQNKQVNYQDAMRFYQDLQMSHQINNPYFHAFKPAMTLIPASSHGSEYILLPLQSLQQLTQPTAQYKPHYNNFAEQTINTGLSSQAPIFPFRPVNPQLANVNVQQNSTQTNSQPSDAPSNPAQPAVNNEIEIEDCDEKEQKQPDDLDEAIARKTNKKAYDLNEIILVGNKRKRGRKPQTIVDYIRETKKKVKQWKKMKNDLSIGEKKRKEICNRINAQMARMRQRAAMKEVEDTLRQQEETIKAQQAQIDQMIAQLNTSSCRDCVTTPEPAQQVFRIETTNQDRNADQSQQNEQPIQPVQATQPTKIPESAAEPQKPKTCQNQSIQQLKLKMEESDEESEEQPPSVDQRIKRKIIDFITLKSDK